MSRGYHTIFLPTKTQDKEDSPPHPSWVDGADDDDADHDTVDDADVDADNDAAMQTIDGIAADYNAAMQMMDNDAEDDSTMQTTTT
jgi:hypothetical protein